MNFLAHLKYAFRQMSKNPGFFAVAVAALALGIGANTAIFSAVEAVLLKRLPYAQPDRLVIVWEDASYLGFEFNTPAPGNYIDWRAQNHVFTDMAATRFTGANLTGDGKPEQLSGKKITSSFFDVLGVQPVLGRPFTAQEDQASAKVAVISHSLWQRRFGSDPSIIGRGILLDGITTTIVGIMPGDFFFRERNVDYWAPFSFTPEQWSNRHSHYLTVVARLKPGITAELARKDMERVAENLQRQYPESNAKVGAKVVPLRQDFAGKAQSGLWVLQVASIFVLLIACSNLANLLLARSAGRRREIAVRTALGATRAQIAAQLLTESLLLSLMGGALGLFVGQACWSIFANLIPAQVGSSGLQIDARVLFFTAAISIVSGLLFGFAPALRASDASLHDALKEGARTGESRKGLRLRDGFVVAQFALAFALLAGAGLMIESLWNLHKEDLGFRSDHLLTMAIPIPKTKYDTDGKTRAFFREVTENARAIPGVSAAGFASDAPFTAEGDTEGYSVEGEPPMPVGEYNDALYREVTPGYLETVGARLVEGRLLDGTDREDGLRALVINEFFAKRHFPGRSALGKRIHFGLGTTDDTQTHWWTIVGVVRDIRERGLLFDMKPAVYVPVTQADSPQQYSFLVLRTSNDPASVLKAVESAVWSVDSQQPMTQIRTMDQLIEEDVADRTRPMILLGVFAGLALLLACIGVYGVLAYAVAQRTREIGVRMALGARPLDVTRMVLARGMALSAIGLGTGAAIGLSLSSLLRSLLYGVAPSAPGVYLATAALLMLVALAACVIPAQRASRVDPVRALRDE
jgi:putative ABC transport system permease protein